MVSGTDLAALASTLKVASEPGS
ncbi:MAG: hypothetical protein QOG21_1737, partial [Actinomycetota bacterium]|nr:hypothetical protein [Actinomycetota bacterium]